MADGHRPIEETEPPAPPAPEGTGEPHSDAFAETLMGDAAPIAAALSGDMTLGSVDTPSFRSLSNGGELANLVYRQGEVISDRYLVTGVLGQGGFAVVYSARDKVVDRQVAVKVLNPMADVDGQNAKRSADRFEREARAAAMITHANVVTIFDLGVTHRLARPYIVMELLEGHDLADEIREGGPMEPARALRLFGGALAGLAAGHERGIVHKDLKPANLFLTHPGTDEEELRLFDFGIARLGSGEKGLTKTGEMFGTPQYMAPEYISAGQVSPALDVYQMGLILVEMLTGKKVVDVEVAITAAMTHGQGALPLPVEVLDGPLGEVVRRSLALDPTERYADAAAFAAALDAISSADLPARLSGDTMLLSEAPPTTGLLRGEIDEMAETAQHDVGGGSPIKWILPMAVAVGLLLVWLMVGRDTTPAASPPPPPPPAAAMGTPTSPPAPPPEVPVAAAEPDAAITDVGVPDAALPPPIQVRLTVEPAGATITVDGEAFDGETLEFADERAAARTIEVSRAGFRPQAREVGPGDGPEVTVKLARTHRVRPPQPIAAPKKPIAKPKPPPPPEPSPAAPDPAPEPTPVEPAPAEPSGSVILD